MLLSREIHRLLLRISAIIGIICVYAGSALKSKVSSQWHLPLLIGVIAGAVLLSSLVPGLLAWALSRWRWYRRLVLGDTWIEGAWLLESRRAIKPNETGPKRIRYGVVTYTYPGQYLSLRTDGHHLEFTEITEQPIDNSDPCVLSAHGKCWRQSPAIRAQSKLAFMDASLTYINVFKYDGESSGDGVAIGWFASDQGRPPEAFTATIVTKSGDIFYQSGSKLDDKLVAELKNDHFGDWRTVLIRHRFKAGEFWRKTLSEVHSGWSKQTAANGES